VTTMPGAGLGLLCFSVRPGRGGGLEGGLLRGWLRGGGCVLAEVDRLMSGAISCGRGSILLSAGGEGEAFLVERWLLWALAVDRL